ncbi:MAG TPA: hypothetical protein VGP57_13655 [Actinoplanes sp.]|nr:hypothetical protein [Actinoplanes sp.]
MTNATEPAQHAGTRNGLLRPVLWLVLVLSAAANAVTSTIGINPLVGIGFGLVTLGCATTLIVHHYQHRRA